jgi:hypothetical protein
MPEHLDHTLTAMADNGIDVLLLGREANTRYVTGANRLWLAGTRPFAPGCVVVRDTRAVHLLSITDEGVGPLVPRDHLYPISWNPMNVVGGVAAIPGVEDAKTIGVDGMTPLFEQLIAALLRDPKLVDAEAVLRDARRFKTDDDIEGIRAAATVARDSLDAAFAAFTPGTSPNELKGVFTERMCSHGVTTPAFEAEFSVDGDVVSARAGVIREGWEAVLARTHPPNDALRTRHREAVELCSAWPSVAELRWDGVTVEGVGVGHEILLDTDALQPRVVVYLEVSENGAVHGDTVHVTAADPEVLTADL